MRLIGKIVIRVLIAIAIEAICVYIQSPFLVDFLKERIVEIIVTLLAINIATNTFIVSKLSEIQKETKLDFSEVHVEIKGSIVMQIILVFMSVLILSLFKSEILAKYSPDILYKSLDVFLIFIFISAIDILKDTGFAMLEIFSHEKKD